MSRDYNIAWEVTENCNHNCFYCYNCWREDGYVAADDGAGTDYERVTDRLMALHPLSVALTGGEPLVVFERLKSSIARFTEAGIFVRLLTNGSLVTDEAAAFLAQHGVQLMVSFPTADAARFAEITRRAHYDAVVRGLDILKRHGVDVLINVVVSEVNLGDMEATADFLIVRYGYDRLYFSRATKPQNAAPALWERLLDNDALQTFFDTCLRIKKRYGIEVRTCGGYAYCAIRNPEAFSIFAKGCGGGRSSFVISNNGDLRVCGKDAEVFGNIFDSDVDEIMDSAAFWTEESAIPSACDGCRYRHSCRGGCHMSSRDAAPRYNSLDGNADPTSVPVIPRARGRRSVILPWRRYALSTGAHHVRTERGNRVSCAFSYVYLTDKLTQKLCRGDSITLVTVWRLTGGSYKRCRRLLAEMITKKIVTETDR